MTDQTQMAESVKTASKLTLTFAQIACPHWMTTCPSCSTPSPSQSPREPPMLARKMERLKSTKSVVVTSIVSLINRFKPGREQKYLIISY